MDIAYYAYTKTVQPLPGGAGQVGTEENVIQLAKSPSGQWQVTGMSAAMVSSCPAGHTP